MHLFSDLFFSGWESTSTPSIALSNDLLQPQSSFLKVKSACSSLRIASVLQILGVLSMKLFLGSHVLSPRLWASVACSNHLCILAAELACKSSLPKSNIPAQRLEFLSMWRTASICAGNEHSHLFPPLFELYLRFEVPQVDPVDLLDPGHGELDSRRAICPDALPTSSACLQSFTFSRLS